MSDLNYLRRLFQAYYKEQQSKIPIVNFFEKREFGFMPWEKFIMIRHIGFDSQEILKNYFIINTPRHAYMSGSLYSQPENQDMDSKGYQGCDLIIDIDVDHFYTSCKEDHDLWTCKECGKTGKGMPKKCPSCGKLKLQTLNWICDECLNIAKNEIMKLIYNFLIPDFGINLNHMKIAFSGHRGYHLKIENDKIRTLSTDERREIADYLTGENITFEILGLQEKGGNIYGLSKQNIGWSHKITQKIEDFLKKPDLEIQNQLSNPRRFHFRQNLIKSFLNSKNDFLKIIESNNKNIWTIEGFGLNTWNKFLTGIVHEIGIEIDSPVTIDIHRLIRYPGSLHGKTGFKVQEIFPDELDDFNPLDEINKSNDPIVFKSNKSQKLEITEPKVPMTKIKGEEFGPYTKGEIIEVPHHIAVFLLCKEVAKTV
ncbi:MAG: DNA primase small subunit domain-containing protein [Promethearchaeota archaeon]